MLESNDGRNDPKRDVKNAAAPPPTKTVAAAAAGSTLEDSKIDDKPDGLLVGFATIVSCWVTATFLSMPTKNDE